MSVTVRSAAKITGIAPQFLVDDLERAIAYYRDRLGFELDFVYESFTRASAVTDSRYTSRMPR